MRGQAAAARAASVSVVIPAYNAERYIKDTIASALAQTHPPEEVLVVDDGSTDDTVARVQEFPPPVRLLVLQNGGVSRARNHASALARGEWLAFLDADDLWAPNKLERQLQVQATAYGGRAELVYTDRLNIGVLEGLPTKQSAIQPLVEGEVFADLLTENVVTTSTVMLTRSLFDRLGGFIATYQPAEDWEFWLRCARETVFAAVHEPLVRYRLHAQGASRDSGKMNRARELIVESALQSREGQQLAPRLRRRIRAKLWQTNAWDAARAGNQRDAVLGYLRALRREPLELVSYKGVLRTLLGNSRDVRIPNGAFE